MLFRSDNDRLFWAAESRTCGGLLHEIDITTGAASALGNVLYMGSEPCEIVALHAPCENKSGVTSVAAGTGEVNIAVDGDCITVTCDEGLAVSVCDVDGRVIASAHGPATFRNIGQGIVLVKAGETVKKVVVKKSTTPPTRKGSPAGLPLLVGKSDLSDLSDNPILCYARQRMRACAATTRRNIVRG